LTKYDYYLWFLAGPNLAGIHVRSGRIVDRNLVCEFLIQQLRLAVGIATGPTNSYQEFGQITRIAVGIATPLLGNSWFLTYMHVQD